MRYGSVCSGIESASVAWESLGWSAAWFSEVEPFPSAVLAHHWPSVANLGDMAQLPTLLSAGLIEAPEILVGGTPCQAFSVAGMRKGLDDERGQLTIKYVEVANEIDKQRPRGEECIVVWENVPGVLSSKDNAFGCFLAALVGEDDPLEPAGKKWSNAGIVCGPQRVAAWRILDAQYFGVAQRRRRVFVVASARNGFDPAAVLFECESLRRDTPPSRETGQTVAEGATIGIDEECNASVDIFGPLLRGGQGGTRQAVAYHTTGAGYWQEGAGTLRAREQDSHENIIAMAHGQGGAEVREDGGGPTLTCNHEAPIVCHGSQDPVVLKDKALPLGRNGGRENVVAIQGSVANRGEKSSQNGVGVNKDICFTLNTLDRHALQADTTVRRLTPVECERLQGFPDNHTRIAWRKKTPEDCPDGPRYKAIGNSKAVPVIQWVGERIKKHLKEI